jgi:hypothetical protein
MFERKKDKSINNYLLNTTQKIRNWTTNKTNMYCLKYGFGMFYLNVKFEIKSK